MYLRVLIINITIILSSLISKAELQQQQQQQLPPNCRTTSTTVTCQNASDTVISLVPLNTTRLTLFEMNLVSGTALDTELSRLTNLQYLNISKNKLVNKVPLNALKNLTNLTSVILRDNSIKTLPTELASLVHSKSITIDVSENLIQCTCTTVYIVEKSTVKLVGQCNEPFQTPLNSLNTTILNCDPCSDNKCFHGDCINIDALTSKCHCFPSFTGAYCTVPIVQQECQQNNCQNGGTCYIQNFDSSTFCACRPGTTGELCQVMTSAQSGDGDSDTIVAAVVPVSVILVLVAVGCLYCVYIRPKRLRLRSNSKRKQKNSTASDIQICSQVNWSVLFFDNSRR